MSAVYPVNFKFDGFWQSRGVDTAWLAAQSFDEAHVRTGLA